MIGWRSGGICMVSMVRFNRFKTKRSFKWSSPKKNRKMEKKAKWLNHTTTVIFLVFRYNWSFLFSACNVMYHWLCVLSQAEFAFFISLFHLRIYCDRFESSKSLHVVQAGPMNPHAMLIQSNAAQKLAAKASSCRSSWTWHYGERDARSKQRDATGCFEDWNLNHFTWWVPPPHPKKHERFVIKNDEWPLNDLKWLQYIIYTHIFFLFNTQIHQDVSTLLNSERTSGIWKLMAQGDGVTPLPPPRLPRVRPRLDLQTCRF